MKASKYNYIINKNDFSYWYNGIEHTFFKLPIDLGKKVKELITINPTSLLPINKAFYDKLTSNGFIIGDNIDELNIIRTKYKEEINKKDYFLIVLPTLNCNFKCWYCIQDHIPSIMSADTINKVKAHIDYMIGGKRIKSLHLEWFGGEPFMFFQRVIKPISQYAIEQCKKANISFYNSATTNGYYLTPTVLKDLTPLNFKKFQITLDGPQKIHDSVKFQQGCSSAFQRTLQNIENILNTSVDIIVSLRINYTQESLNNIIVEQINGIVSPINRSRIIINPKKVWQEKVNKAIFKETGLLLNSFKISGYNVVRFDIINNFVPCYANRKYYNAINYNGDVVKCTANDDLYTNDAPGHLNEDGSITWRKDFKVKFYKKRFENNTCLICNYLPICMGLCPRDYNKEKFYCKMENSDINIENALIDYIDSEYERDK